MSSPFFIPALLIALVMVMALLSLAVTPGDGARALPTSTNAYVEALRAQGGNAPIDPTSVPTVPPTARPSYATRTPTPSVAHSVGTVVKFLRGQATWWNSWGHGFYVAVNPSDGIRVGSVIQVCDAHAQHCLSAPVTTTCACKGRDSGRIVDLSLDLFRHFADPSRGTTQVVLEVTP